MPTLKISRSARWLAVGAISLGVVTILGNQMLTLKLYPVLVNFGFLVAFGYSLISPPSMVERFARMREPDFPSSAISYTRRVTQVWCGFFCVNGAIAFATAIWASEAIWLLYTGVISYVMMGILFGVEFLVRLRFRRQHHD